MIRFRRRNAEITNETILPDEDGIVVSPMLKRATERRNQARVKVARSIIRAADRRRIVPVTVVSTLVLVGVGLADASVQSTIPPPTPPPTLPPATVPPTTISTAKLNEANSELAAVANVLASDQSSLARLQQAAERSAASAASVGSAVSFATPASATGRIKIGAIRTPGGAVVAPGGSSGSSASASSNSSSAGGLPTPPPSSSASQSGAAAAPSSPAATTPAPTTTTVTATTVVAAPPATQATTGASSAG